VRGLDVHAKLLDEPGQTRRLPLRQVEDEPRERRGVDDRVLERALEAAADEPRVERVVAVLDQHGGLRKAQKRPPRVLELGRADQHRPLDLVPAPGVGVDRRTAVDERVEEAERALEREPLGADLEDEKRRVAGRLDVEGDELRVVERRPGPDLRRVDCDLGPGHRLGRAARLEVDTVAAHRAVASARRAHEISSLVTARRISTATAYTAAPTAIGSKTSYPWTPLSG
jgi:hypothetical protein